MGTYGYCAPEYASTGQLTTKSDVYSFGAVYLELITGRRAVDTARSTEEQNLVTWLGYAHKQKLDPTKLLSTHLLVSTTNISPHWLVRIKLFPIETYVGYHFHCHPYFTWTEGYNSSQLTDCIGVFIFLTFSSLPFFLPNDNRMLSSLQLVRFLRYAVCCWTTTW